MEEGGSTLPLTMPRFRDKRADVLLEVGLETSLMPSGPLGMESRPPMMQVARNSY